MAILGLTTTGIGHFHVREADWQPLGTHHCTGRLLEHKPNPHVTGFDLSPPAQKPVALVVRNSGKPGPCAWRGVRNGVRSDTHRWTRSAAHLIHRRKRPGDPCGGDRDKDDHHSPARKKPPASRSPGDDRFRQSRLASFFAVFVETPIAASRPVLSRGNDAILAGAMNK